MPNHTGLSPNSPNKYLGPNVYLTSVVTRDREPTGADYRQPETGKLYPFNTFWLVSKDPTTGVQGDMWYLSKIVANVAYWVKLSTGGTGPFLEIEVDANTAPGTDPVLPDAGGLLTITGGQVATGVIGANVIRTNSLAANTFTIQIQRSTTAASANSTLNGVSHYNASQFTVDSDGFVSLSGGGAAVDSFTVDQVTVPGVNPVTPNGSGNVTVRGGQGVITESVALNEYTIHSLKITEVTGTSQAMASDNGYIANNAGLVTLTLPTTIGLGERLQVVGKGTGLWRLAQNANQLIHFGILDTTTGVGGRLDATSQYDTIDLMCTVANLEFTVTSSVGTITVT